MEGDSSGSSGKTPGNACSETEGAHGGEGQESRGAITRLLERMGAGDAEAFEALVPLVYDELRQIAHAHLRRLRPGRTLDTTSLVNEAYLKLAGGRGVGYANRSHFFAVASSSMRQILVDHARYLSREKRGGAQPTLQLDDESAALLVHDADQFLDLDRALDRLAERSPRQVRIIECRYFAGLTADETAEALGIGRRTVYRDWLQAKAWLRSELEEE